MGFPTVKFHRDGTLPETSMTFVFGSNLAGIHGAGAAKIAVAKFGAVYGIAKGYRGRSYAIPTKDNNLRALSLSEIEHYVRDFVEYTNHGMIIDSYFVTRVGCGLAGYKDHQIAPMFRGASKCSFAEEWRPYLEEIQHERV